MTDFQLSAPDFCRPIPFEQTINTARSDRARPFWPISAIEVARGQIPVALLGFDAHQCVLEHAGEAAADGGAKRQGWFAAIADESVDG